MTTIFTNTHTNPDQSQKNRMNSVVLAGENECPICFEKHNETTRKPIRCPKCEFSACLKCVTTQLLASATELRCIDDGCRATWSRTHMLERLPKSFLQRTWKEHQEQLLLERERSFLPQEQEPARVWTSLKERKIALTEEIAELNVEISSLKRKLNDKVIETYSVRHMLDNMENGRHTPAANESSSGSNSIMPCPADDCRGYLTEEYVCKLCDRPTCKSCMRGLKDNDEKNSHKCDPGDLASARAIRKDSKRCPGCGVYIFRISGCPSMFCTHCHVGFRWDTLRITSEGEAAHNPHYYEYMAARDRGGSGSRPSEAMNVCNEGPIPPNALRTAMGLTYHRQPYGFSYRHNISSVTPDTAKRRALEQINQLSNHVEHLQTHNYSRQNRPQGTALSAQSEGGAPVGRAEWPILRKTRWQFLSKEIDEVTWKRKVFHNEKILDRDRDVAHVLEMFVACTRDCLRRVLVRGDPNCFTEADAENIAVEISTITEYANESLKKISKVYKTKVPQIDLGKFEVGSAKF